MSHTQQQSSWWLDAGEYLKTLNFLHNQVSNLLWLSLAVGSTYLVFLPQSILATIVVVGSTCIWLSNKNQDPSKPKDSWLNRLSQYYQSWTQKPLYQLILCITLVWGTATSLYAFSGLVVQSIGLTSQAIQLSLFYLGTLSMITIQKYKDDDKVLVTDPNSKLEVFQHYSMQPYFALSTTLTITSILTSMVFSSVTLFWLAVILTLAAITEYQHRQAICKLPPSTSAQSTPSAFHDPETKPVSTIPEKKRQSWKDQHKILSLPKKPLPN